MKNKLYYTEDIIDEVCKKGYRKEQVIDFLKHYVSYLRNEIKNNEESAYYIPNLGTIYLTITGVNYSVKEIDNSLNKIIGENQTNTLENEKAILLKKKHKIQEYISKLKELGVKRIAYFDKIYNPKGIKNA